MSSRILFVDDEALVLQGLQRSLRGMREEWQMEFVTSGADALAAMARHPFDAIVSDMRMPGMNGAELLNEVMKLYPGTARFILSGHAEEELIMRCVGITHQFLSKPCEADEIKSAVKRALSVGSTLGNPRLREFIGRIDHLPSIPILYTELVEKLQDPEVELTVIADIVAKDIAMTAKVLQLVNSAFFGLSRKVTDMEGAVSYLGIDTLKTLVLTIHAFDQFDGVEGSAAFLRQLWTHSLDVAAAAKRIAHHARLAPAAVESAFVAGMLHDIGQLVFKANLNLQYDEVVAKAHLESQPLEAVEASVLGATHAEVGGYLLGLWGLPVPIVEAITLHHKPADSLAIGLTPLTAVHVAEAFCQPANGPEAAPPARSPDLDYLATLGVVEQLDSWK